MNSDSPEPMDTPLLQLERELLSLTPVRPDSDLISRLTACVEADAGCCRVPLRAHRRRAAANPRPGPFPWRVVTPAAAAVMVVAVIGQNDRLSRTGLSVRTGGDRTAGASTAVNSLPATPEIVVREMIPAGFQREIQSMQDHGYSWNGGPSPSHQFSWRVLDHHVFQSPDNSGRIRLSIPREERASVPVNFH